MDVFPDVDSVKAFWGTKDRISPCGAVLKAWFGSGWVWF